MEAFSSSKIFARGRREVGDLGSGPSPI
jgi:hypothetical protein